MVNPSSVQYKNGPEAPGDFAKGKAAMLMSQNNADNTLQADGMKPSDYGVVAIPAPEPLPAGGKDVASFVAGINLSVFQNTKNKDAALKLVKFLTSPEEQAILDKPFTALPVVKGGTVNFTTDAGGGQGLRRRPGHQGRAAAADPRRVRLRDQRRQRRQRPAGPGGHRQGGHDERHQGRPAGGPGQDGRGRQLTRRRRP